VLVGEPGQHHYGNVRRVLPHPADALESVRVRQVEVEQGADAVTERAAGVAQGSRAAQDERHPGVKQQFLDQERVAIVVLDEEDVHALGQRRAGRAA